MCLLAMFYRVVDDAPVVVGANREEVYVRGGTTPQVIAGPRRALAGLDPVAGGTWLGVNAAGVFVALTNRPKSVLPNRPRSRGLLVRELLGLAGAREAVDCATRELSSPHYAGCNLLVADTRSAVVVQAGDWLRVRPLPPGLHVLTAHDVNDAGDQRLGHALTWLGQRDYGSAGDCVEALKDLCAQAGGDGQPPMCLHGPDRGTVSSTIVALRAILAHSIYLHAQGPPDRTAYEDYSAVLAGL